MSSHYEDNGHGGAYDGGEHGGGMDGDGKGHDGDEYGAENIADMYTRGDASDAKQYGIDEERTEASVAIRAITTDRGNGVNDAILYGTREDLLSDLRAVSAEGMSAKPSRARDNTNTHTTLSDTMTESEGMKAMERFLIAERHIAGQPAAWTIYTGVDGNYGGGKGHRVRITYENIFISGALRADGLGGVNMGALQNLPSDDRLSAYKRITDNVLSTMKKYLMEGHSTHLVVCEALAYAREPEKYLVAPTVSTAAEVWAHFVDACELHRESTVVAATRTISEMGFTVLEKGGTVDAIRLWASRVMTAVEGIIDGNGEAMNELTPDQDQEVTKNAVCAARVFAAALAIVYTDKEAEPLLAAVKAVFAGDAGGDEEDPIMLAAAIMKGLTAKGDIDGHEGDDELRREIGINARSSGGTRSLLFTSPRRNPSSPMPPSERHNGTDRGGRHGESGGSDGRRDRRGEYGAGSAANSDPGSDGSTDDDMLEALAEQLKSASKAARMDQGKHELDLVRVEASHGVAIEAFVVAQQESQLTDVSGSGRGHHSPISTWAEEAHADLEGGSGGGGGGDHGSTSRSGDEEGSKQSQGATGAVNTGSDRGVGSTPIQGGAGEHEGGPFGARSPMASPGRDKAVLCEDLEARCEALGRQADSTREKVAEAVAQRAAFGERRDAIMARMSRRTMRRSGAGGNGRGGDKDGGSVGGHSTRGHEDGDHDRGRRPPGGDGAHDDGSDLDRTVKATADAARRAKRLANRHDIRLQYTPGGYIQLMETILASAIDIEMRLRKSLNSGLNGDDGVIRCHRAFQLGATKAAARVLANRNRTNAAAVDRVMNRGGDPKFTERAGNRGNRTARGERGFRRPVERGGRGTLPSRDRGRNNGAVDDNGEREARINYVFAAAEDGHEHHGHVCTDDSCLDGFEVEHYVESGLRRCYTCGCSTHHRLREDCPFDARVNDAKPVRTRLAEDGSEAMCYKCGEVGVKGVVHNAENCTKDAVCMEKDLNPSHPCDGKHQTRDCPVRQKSKYTQQRSPSDDRGGDAGGTGGGGYKGGKGGKGGSRGGKN